MSGDVFGNGMLLPQQIELVAAFDHRHIFIDPSPNPAAALGRAQAAVRPAALVLARLRHPPLLSAGGGIYDPLGQIDRALRRARMVLGIETPNLTPADLMRAILTAPVDLLYFGGIGTYVKASSESNADAGDRQRSIRVDARAVARESGRRGANLGFTQRARIEAALAAAGSTPTRSTIRPASTLRHNEVNIRSRPARRSPGLLPRADRDALLFSMTDEVAAWCLRHNYQQSQAISVAAEQAGEEHDRLERFMRALERQGRLDRAVEFLPIRQRCAAAARAASI